MSHTMKTQMRTYQKTYLGRAMLGALSLLMVLANPVSANEYGGTMKAGEWRPLGKGFMGRANTADLSAVRAILSDDEYIAARNAGANNAVAVWLRTENEGLHKVSVPDLAAMIGVNVEYMQQLVEDGDLRLSYLNRRLRWHYDADLGAILFAAEKNDNLYTDQNAYHVRILNRNNQTMRVRSGNGPSSGSNSSFFDTLTFEEVFDFGLSNRCYEKSPKMLIEIIGFGCL